jgi:aspartate/glutamate racemase
MPTSKETQEFIDDIDDPMVKVELLQMCAAVAAVEGGFGDQATQDFVASFNAAQKGQLEQVANQKASINRLLDERRQNLGRINELERRLSNAKHSLAVRNREEVGPE